MGVSSTTNVTGTEHRDELGDGIDVRKYRSENSLLINIDSAKGFSGSYIDIMED